MGYECNLKCDYCSITDEMRKRNMTTERIKREIKCGLKMGFRDVSFGGGEPTIRNDLLELVSFAKENGAGKIKIQSNGLMYYYRDFCEKLIEKGAGRFHISVMGHNKELYDKITGWNGSYEFVIAGIKNLLNLNVDVFLDVIIKNDTYIHLIEIIKFYSGMGVKNFFLWLVSLTDRNKYNYESLPSVKEMRNDIFKSFEESRKLKVNTFSRHIPRCMLRGYEDHCHNLRDDRVYVVSPEGNFNLQDSLITANTYTKKCKSCLYYQGVCMGVREDYLQRFGDSEIIPYK